MKREDIKFPCSSAGKLLVGLKEFTKANRRDALELVAKKKQKRDGTLGGKRWTPKNEKDLNDLMAKRKVFELGEGAKTYIFDRWKYKSKSVKKWMEADQVFKGKIVEKEAVKLLDEVMPLPIKRKLSEGFISNDYLVGITDISLSLTGIKEVDEIEDIKCPYNKDNFLDVLKKIDDEAIDPLYYCQAQCYLEIQNAETYRLCYCGMNTPKPILNRELMRARRKYFIGSTFFETDMVARYEEAVKRITNLHTFDDMSMDERVIYATIKRDRKYMRKLERVINTIARDYYMLLVKHNGRIPKELN